MDPAASWYVPAGVYVTVSRFEVTSPYQQIAMKYPLALMFSRLNQKFFFFTENKRRCGFFLDVFGLALPEYLDCALFPESSDPNICVGHHEVKAAKLRASRPGKYF